MNIDEALNIFELEHDCSFDDAKHAYRELIRIWHPDRYRHDPKLQIRANKKTQMLNSAWEFIEKLGEKGFLEQQRRSQAKEPPKEETSETYKASEEATAKPENKRDRDDVSKHPAGYPDSDSWQFTTHIIIGAFVLIVCLVLFGQFKQSHVVDEDVLLQNILKKEEQKDYKPVVHTLEKRREAILSAKQAVDKIVPRSSPSGNSTLIGMIHDEYFETVVYQSAIWAVVSSGKENQFKDLLNMTSLLEFRKACQDGHNALADLGVKAYYQYYLAKEEKEDPDLYLFYEAGPFTSANCSSRTP